MTRKELIEVAKAASYNAQVAPAIRSGAKTMTSRPIRKWGDGSPLTSFDDFGVDDTEGDYFSGLPYIYTNDPSSSRTPPVYSYADWPRGIYPVGTICWVREPGISLQYQRGDGEMKGTKMTNCKYSDGNVWTSDGLWFSQDGIEGWVGKHGKGFANGIPKVFARSFYRVTERGLYYLPEMSQRMAISEGIQLKTPRGSGACHAMPEYEFGSYCASDPVTVYHKLWDSIYGKRGMSVKQVSKSWPGICAYNKFEVIDYE